MSSNYVSIDDISEENKKAILKEFSEIKFTSEEQFVEWVKGVAQKHHLSYATFMEIIFYTF